MSHDHARAAGPLTKDQTTALKGLGILLIVLHNFFHNLPPVIGENEFGFSAAVMTRFEAAMALGPTEWPRALFSVFGHYGVSVFVLLSAYGLARSRARRAQPYREFMRARFDKVYVSFAVCVALYAALWVVRAQVTSDTDAFPWHSLLLKLTLVSNFFPDQALGPVGPWWFVPFIFQLYALFPPLARLGRRPWALVVVAAAALLLEFAVNDALMGAHLNINHTVLGHLPVACLGIYLASLDRVPWGWGWVAIAAVGFAAGAVNPYWWLLSDVWAAMLLVAVPLLAARHVGVPAMAHRVCGFYGEISMPLFMVNGFLRSPFASIAISGGRWWHGILAAILSLLFSTIMALVLMRLDGLVRSWLTWAPARQTGHS